MIYAHFFVQIQLTHTFLLQKWFEHTFLLQKQFTHVFLSWKRLTRFFVAKWLTHRPEFFCALKVTIRKVQTFWASAGQLIIPYCIQDNLSDLHLITLHNRSDAHINRDGVQKASVIHVLWEFTSASCKLAEGLFFRHTAPLLGLKAKRKYPRSLKNNFSSVKYQNFRKKVNSSARANCPRSSPPPCSESHTTHMLLLPGPSTSTIVVAF